MVSVTLEVSNDQIQYETDGEKTLKEEVRTRRGAGKNKATGNLRKGENSLVLVTVVRYHRLSTSREE